MKIEDHPDISAIKQLARSLHKQGTAGGAAALVGAGMSRSARTLKNMPAPPLWGDLKKEMIEELYGDQRDAANATNATQLAEEFRSTLGDAALVDFLKRHITDDVWEPTQIHSDLLDLPWSDVMTTNYDTLLERASKDSDRRYVPVLNEGDLAHASSPRIIKLHGTTQNMHKVIFSEEDYRTYPEKHPAFLNTARQIFIENELCLIGFSGEDPNFLNWAGWVRDILKSGARRIFLVGILNLNHSKRKLFERQNIVPIDLGCLFDAGEDQIHQKAYEIFFEYLKSLEPKAPDEWSIIKSREYWSQNHDDMMKLQKDSEFAKPVLLKTTEAWMADRKAFPGWLIAPKSIRSELFHNTEIYSFSKEMLSALNNSEKKLLLSELAWRQNKMLMPLSEFVLQEILTLADCPEGFGTFAQEVREDVLQVVVQSLSEYHDNEKFQEFAKAYHYQDTDPDLQAFVYYYKCINAYRRLDFDYVAQHIDNIITKKSDPIWLARKAGLFFGIGDSKRAQHSLQEAISELKTLQRNDPDSMWVQSRLSWVMWVGNGLRWENPEFADQKNLLRRMQLVRGCDPELMLETFRSEFKEALNKQVTTKELVPKFETGAFKDNSQTIFFGSPSWGKYHYGFFCTLALTGVPLKTNYVNFAETTAQQAYELDKQENIEWYLGLLSTHPGYDSDVINVHFSRIAIARLETELVSEIIPLVRNGIEFWRNRICDDDKTYNGFAVERLRALIEILSRLSIRMGSQEAIHHFKLGCALANDKTLKHWWLFGPLSNLLKNTFSAVEPKDRKKLTSFLLEFPFSADVSDPTEREWPDIASIGYKGFQYYGDKSYLRNKVIDFLHRLSNDNKSRAEAALRLTYLLDAKLLTKTEEKKFTDALWKDVEQQENALPKGTNLYPHIFAWLPSLENIDTRERVYQALYHSDDNKLEGVWNIADAITLAARDVRTQLVPKAEKAKRMFEAITKWRPKTNEHEESPFNFGQSAKKQMDRSVGSVLSFAVVDQLEQVEINAENATKVLTLIDEQCLTSALPALIAFLDINSEVDEKIIRRIRQAVTSRDHNEIFDGLLAITKLLERGQNNKNEETISRSIVSGVLKALFRAPELGLSSLIECAQWLAKYGQFNSDDISEVVELLEDLFRILDYSKIELSEARGIGAPMARLQCMVLSKILLESGWEYPILREWVNIQLEDPLPEIRNANMNELIRKKV